MPSILNVRVGTPVVYHRDVGHGLETRPARVAFLYGDGAAYCDLIVDDWDEDLRTDLRYVERVPVGWAGAGTDYWEYLTPPGPTVSPPALRVVA